MTIRHVTCSVYKVLLLLNERPNWNSIFVLYYTARNAFYLNDNSYDFIHELNRATLHNLKFESMTQKDEE